jgi:2-amino-4,5-dihydroxy-6-oxo-7-(phosphonooxy)heptanoate synthase
MNAGKSRRFRRMIAPSGRTVILPLDIVVPVGPFRGAGDTGALIDMAGEVGVSAVILRWGEAKRYAGRLAPALGLVVRVSGTTGLSSAELPQAAVNTVSASLSVGADAVCIDLELGDERETESLRAFARACEEAEALGVVVLAEVHVPNPIPHAEVGHAGALAWAARTARELGADLVKVAYPGSAAAVATICELAEIPLVVAGGSLRVPEDALRTADEALRGGAAGTAFGRNVIGHHDPAAMQRAVIDLVRGRRPLDEVCARLEASTHVLQDGDGAL